MMKKILIICCMLISLAMPTFAANWYWAGADNSNGQWYIDNDSVVKDWNKGIAIIWIKQTKQDGSYTKDEIGITNTRYMLVFKSLHYNSSEQFLYEVPGSQQPISVVPGTVSEDIYDLVWGA